MNIKYLCVVASVGALASCATTNTSGTDISQSARDKIAMCSAGRTITLTAGIEAKLAKIFKGEGSMDAELRNDLRGAFFEGADPNNPNAVKAFELYQKCMENARI